jgi:hypothetical protein
LCSLLYLAAISAGWLTNPEIPKYSMLCVFDEELPVESNHSTTIGVRGTSISKSVVILY